MRRWMAAPLALAVTLGLFSSQTPRAGAQPKDAVPEGFRTPDGVELMGIFHPATGNVKNAGDAPVVVLMYPPGVDRDMTKGDWGSLIKALNAAGYHAFQFDWRGHGKSTNIADKDKFWGNPFLNRTGFNSYIRGGPPKQPLKGELSVKDISNQTRFMPAYLNDLAGVRLLLDAKNDKGELNSSTIYLVGAGDAAALGFAWLAAEWNRPQVAPNVNQLGFDKFGIPIPRYEVVMQPINGGVADPAGADFGGAVWLTPDRPASFPEATIRKWLSAFPKLRENNPMLFLYAEKDAQGKAGSDFYFNQALVAKPRKGSRLSELPQTFMQDVKGAEKLQGIKLLGDKTEKTIVQYLAALQKARARITSKPRNYTEPYFIDPTALGLGR